MSLLSIAEAINTVKETTSAENVTTAGATLFVKPQLSDDEKTTVRDHLDPQKIRDPDSKVTRVDL